MESLLAIPTSIIWKVSFTTSIFYREARLGDLVGWYTTLFYVIALV